MSQASVSDEAATNHRFQPSWRLAPAPGWRRRSGGMLGSRLTAPLVVVAASAAGIPALTWWGDYTSAETPLATILTSQIGLLALGVLAAAVALRRARYDLLEPLAHLRHWAQRMRTGDLSARVPVPAGTREFTALAGDINRLGEDLQQLTQDMEGRVEAQTEHLARKKESLEILYDVAAGLNGSTGLEDLLTTFLDRLMTLLDAQAGSVRLLTGDDQMRLVASRGLPESAMESERLVSTTRCLCGQALKQGGMHYRHDTSKCAPCIGGSPTIDERMRMVVVPLHYQGRSRGIYNLFVAADQLDRLGDEVDNLLDSVGQQLGMAIEKSRLDREARRLSIIEERTLLAGELHDSIAQNLASMRMAAAMLGNSVRDGDTDRAEADLTQLEAGLEAANDSLRALLNSFRSRLDDQDLIPAIDAHLERFRRETGIPVHFHNATESVELDPDGEVQVFHTLLEALANIRKHSGADQAWVLLDEEGEGYNLRVEDNGRGLDPPSREDRDPDAHFGLALMEERAGRLGGHLDLGQRPGGGTRVSLYFPRRYRLEALEERSCA